MKLKFLASLLSVLCLLVCGPALAEKRVALVIGNSDYESVGRLKNPINDATAIAQSLERLDFGVTLVTDATKSSFETALADFSETSQGADVAVIYYAGHAMEMNGTNYLIPVDAKLKSDVRVAFETLTLDDMLSAVEGVAGLKMVLLDSCRTNPFLADMERRKQGRSIGRGLAKVEAPTAGLLISYSAAAGTVAEDGDGEHSPYTTALLENIEKPGLEINMLFRSVAASVKKQTNGGQTPFEYGSLPDEPIYLKPQDKTVETASLPPQEALASIDCSDATKNWISIEKLDRIDLYREHVSKFSGCAFVAAAEYRIANLEKGIPRAPEMECDRLAADTNDDFRVQTVKVVGDEDLSEAAIAACLAAVQAYPNEARFQYQYARSLSLTKNEAKARERAFTAKEWALKAAEADYISSMVMVALMYSGSSVPFNEDPDPRQQDMWMRYAAEKGSYIALYYLGSDLQQRTRTPEEHAEGRKRMNQAREICKIKFGHACRI